MGSGYWSSFQNGPTNHVTFYYLNIKIQYPSKYLTPEYRINRKKGLLIVQYSNGLVAAVCPGNMS